MARVARRARRSATQLGKAPTGIRGLDEITLGGLPRGRPTLVAGGAGAGKTLLAMEFLVRGATEFGEPGVFLAFEETADDLVKNVASLGWNVDELVKKEQLALDYIHIDRGEIEETGEYDLEALFVRLGYAIDSVGAKRVVLDTLEALFGALGNTAILRSELRRLFRWLKQKRVTAVITAERGHGASFTRHGMEEYVSDCVIVLDHRVSEEVSTRRLRIVKYRGSAHGTNEYPFLIGEHGFEVMPITSLGLQHTALDERISTGVSGLDEMLGGKGLYRGSTVLISGTAGSGKSSLVAHMAHAACRRGERVLYVATEESESQMVRNMRSIGLDLAPWLKNGRLRIHAVRPSTFGLEMHLAMIEKLAREFEPRVLVMDPVTSFAAGGEREDVRLMLTRLVDACKHRDITLVLTSLTGGGEELERTEVHISSIIDTWLLVRDIEQSGERNRGLYILKSRGMAHSNQIREFRLTSHGVELLDVYVGPGEVLTGSARVAQESQDRLAALQRGQERDRLKVTLERKRVALEARVAALHAEFAAEARELEQALAQETVRAESWEEGRASQAASRDRVRVSREEQRRK
jgi:circadian clock protein KaiC